MTTAELLSAWREATRAAELAERLSRLAADAADRTDDSAMASEEIADLADQAAAAATRAAERARAVAIQAREMARVDRECRLVQAGETVRKARAVEADAQTHYREAEIAARRKYNDRAPRWVPPRDGGKAHNVE